MKNIKLFFLSLILFISFSTGLRAEFFTDVIVTSASGIWTDSRAYSNLNAAITAVGANQRTIKIVSPQVVTNLTIPSNVTLDFERDGSITNSGQLTLNTKNINADNRQIFTGVGNIDFASGTVVKSGWFSNFETALALTANDTIVLKVTKPQSLTASFAVGSNVSLEWEAPGNILTVNGGVNITNIGQITAGTYQILAGAGNFRFRDGTSLNLTWFPNLRSALTWISTNEVSLVIHGTNTVDYTDTVQTNIKLNFRDYQGILSISNGITLTIPDANQIDAKNLYGCIDQARFAGLGTASYAGPYCVDLSAVDQGATTNPRSIASLLASIGTSKAATIRLAHSSAGNTTPCTILTPIDWSSTPLIKLEVEHGVVISGTITGLRQPVRPEWWGAAPDGSTASLAASVKAHTASSAVIYSTGIYSFGTVSGGVTMVAIDGGGGPVSIITEGTTKFTCTSTSGINNFFSITNARSVKIDSVSFLDNGTLSSTVGTRGVVIQADTNKAVYGVDIGMIAGQNMTVPLFIGGTSTYRVAGVHVGTLTAWQCTYGYNAANNGDDVTIDALYTYQVQRSFIIYGMAHFRANVWSEGSTAASADLMIEAGQNGGYDTTDIDVKYHSRNTTNTSTLITMAHFDENSHKISNVRIDLDIVTSTAAKKIAFRAYNASGTVENTGATNNTFDQIFIRGTVSGGAGETAIVYCQPSARGSIDVHPAVAGTIDPTVHAYFNVYGAVESVTRLNGVSVAHAGQKPANGVTLAAGQTFTFDTPSGFKIVGMSIASGGGCVVAGSTLSATMNFLSNPDGTGVFDVTSTPGADVIGISKSGASDTISIKNGAGGSSKTVYVTVLGSTVSAITAPSP